MRSDVEVSRLFTDTHEQLPRSLELVGFSCSWELDVNILNLLEVLEIPFGQLLVLKLSPWYLVVVRC